MHITMWVAYDERRLRRTLSFILGPQLRPIRAVGAIAMAIGLLLAVLEPANVLAYACIALGIMLATVVGPLTISRSVRMQSEVLKDGLHMTIDDEAVTVTYPLAESRFKWAGLGKVVETPEVWYVMFGKVQAITIPKDGMTEEQRAQFSAFVAGLTPVYT